MDMDAIALGDDFLKAIETMVAKSDVLIAVIGANWLNSTDDQDSRRPDNSEDFSFIFSTGHDCAGVRKGLTCSLRLFTRSFSENHETRPLDVGKELREIRLITKSITNSLIPPATKKRKNESDTLQTYLHYRHS